MQARRILCDIICLAGLLALPVLSGCNYVGFILSSLPKTVDARYTPPKTPMLILVEHQKNAGMLLSESDELTAFIWDDLTAYKAAPLIDPKKLYELRDREKDVDKMTITQIGKAVGAEQVLYVDLLQLSVGGAQEGIPVHGRIEAVVRVVDVTTGKTMFPAMGQSGWPVSLETPITTSNVSNRDPVAVQRTLLGSAGTAIGRLLHDYTVQ